ncbi:MAG: DUF2617 family protein [Corynebacterium sp.]|nr:DUF2617 family protein [Corynebacterium sp.]
MIVQVQCPAMDVSASALGLRIDGPLPDVLAERTVEGPTSTLSLGVIGASHVVSISADSLMFREEMSCNAPAPLPESKCTPHYDFSSTIEVLSPDQLAQRAAAIPTDWLIARFPGTSPFHITALHGWWESQAWHWHTLHFYPEEHTVVTSRSRYEL